jgi:hypothetical protein
MTKFLKEYFGKILGAIFVGSISFLIYCWTQCISLDFINVPWGEKICTYVVKQPSFKVKYQYGHSYERRDNFIPIKESETLYSDDYYTVCFTPEYKEENWLDGVIKTVDESYVYIFQVTNNQQATLLFPLKGDDNQGDGNPVRNKVKIDFCSLAKNKIFKLDKTLGTEQIYFLAFYQPSKDLELLLGKDDKEGSQLELIKFIQEHRLLSVPVLTFQHRERETPRVQVEYLYASDKEATFQPLTGDSRLFSDGYYKVQFTPSENGYVYVYLLDNSNGKLLDLVKESSFKHEVNTGVTYTLPAECEKAIFIPTEKVGTTTLYFLAFRQPNINLNNMNDEAQLVKDYLDDCSNCVNVQTFQQLAKVTMNYKQILRDISLVTLPVVLSSGCCNMPLSKCSAYCCPVTEEQKPLEFKLSYHYRPNGGKGDSQPLSKDSKLYSSDSYEIKFTPTEDSYIYLYQLDSSSKLFDLIEMSKKFDRKVKTGEEYTFPNKSQVLKLDEVAGAETLYFLACSQPNVELENQFKTMLHAQGKGDKVAAKTLQAGLLEEFNKRTKVDVIGDSLKLCPNCINSITFEHLAKKIMQDKPKSSDKSKTSEEGKQPLPKEVKP